MSTKWRPLDTDPEAIGSAVRGAIARFRDHVPLPVRDRRPSADREWHIKYGGFVVAAIGFVLTRVVVLPVVHLDVTLVQFLAGEVLPLVLGLGVIVVGIGLAVSTLTRSSVNTVATWCLLGTLGMGVVSGTVFFQVSLYRGIPPLDGVWASSLFSNTLIAGAIGGLLVGARSAANRRHRRDLAHQSDQATILNRLLRHEVLNKLSIIQGYTDRSGGRNGGIDGETARLIHRNADHIQEVIQEIGFLTRLRPQARLSFEPVPIVELVEEAVYTVRREYPEADVTLDADAAAPRIDVRADSHLHTVFEELLENAVHHNDAAPPRVDVTIVPRDTHVRVRIADNGPGLPPDQGAILRDGELPSYDDPTTGFGLPLVRMLVSQYDGTIEVDTDPGTSRGTAVTITLPRATAGGRTASSGMTRAGVDPRRLGYATLTALLSGVAMGLILHGLTDTLPAIGGLYGIRSFGIGWVLHLFHSVVFGVAFAAALSRLIPPERGTTLGRYVALGVGYGMVLWAVATGIVMPAWLNAVGIPTPFPLLSLPSLLGHVVWGASFGLLYGYLTP